MKTYSTGQVKEGASVDSAEEMKDTTAIRKWRLHISLVQRFDSAPENCYREENCEKGRAHGPKGETDSSQCGGWFQCR